MIGVDIEKNTSTTEYGGMPLAFGPKILLDPTFGITFNELKSKFDG